MIDMSIKHHDLAPLPVDFDLSQLVDLLSSAHEAVGRYDEVARRFINPDLIAGSLLTDEAQASSTIEGTEISLLEVFRRDARPQDQIVENTTQEKDYREIDNYRQALLKGAQLLDPSQPITTQLLKELHAILLNSVRGQDRTPGEFRTRLVYIGRPEATVASAKYLPPQHAKIANLVNNLLDYINDYKEHSALIRAAVGHYQFEAIHPFADGNGRLGRMLIPLQLYRDGLLAQPNLYLSSFFEEHRREYIASLRQVDRSGDWQQWLEFFLQGIRSRAYQQILRIEQIEDFYNSQRQIVGQLNSKYAQAVFDGLFKRPIFDIKQIMSLASIRQYHTARDLVNKLVKLGVVKPFPHDFSRSRLYSCTGLVEILSKR